MVTTATGLVVPARTNAFDPQGDIGDLAASLEGRIIVPVANVTARTALAAAVAPSPTEPLYVFRADAAPGLQLEQTTDGTTWVSLTQGQFIEYTASVSGFAIGTLPVGVPKALTRYRREGLDLVRLEYLFVFGSNGQAPTYASFTLPPGLPPVTQDHNYQIIGVGSMFRPGSSQMFQSVTSLGVAGQNNAQIFLTSPTSPATGVVSPQPNVPWSWASGDIMRGSGWYRTSAP